MKQWKGLDKVILLLAGCLFLSCHQHSILEHKELQRSLEIVLENFSSEVSRTIAPSQITAAQLQAGGTYQLKISGTTGRMTLPEQVITFANGRATLPNIEAGLWELTLAAYQGTTKVLEGKSTVQVHAVGNTTVSFLLKPVKLSTGTIDITFNWQETDRAYAQSQYPSQLTVSLSLYNTQTNRMVPGTEAIWTRSRTNTSTIATTLRYRGGGRGDRSYNIDAGEYLLVFRVFGGILAERGTELYWKDNLYVEAGRQTTGTITLPQLHTIPAMPVHFDARVNSDADTYTSHLEWSKVYNSDSYEVEIKSFTTGNWTTFNETTWNGLSGGKVYSYKVSDYWKTTDGPVCVEGGLSKDSNSIKFYTTKSGSNQFLVVRIRAVNTYGASGWRYLPYLHIPKPTINTLPITRVGQGSNAGRNEFDVTFNITEVNRTRWNITGYRIEWFRLDRVKAHYGCTDQEAFEKVDTDEEWAAELAAGRKMGGEMDYKYTGFAAGRQAGPSMLLWGLNGPSKFCMRIRAYIDGKGYSEWVYWPTLVQAAP